MEMMIRRAVMVYCFCWEAGTVRKVRGTFGKVPTAWGELYHAVGAEEGAAIGARVYVLGGGWDTAQAAETQSESS